MKFADIPAHHDIKERLRRMVDSGRVPHALLLSGPAGAGKFALARAFAQYLHCQNRTPDGDSCGTCPACRQHETFNHIDTYYSYPVVKAGSGGVTISADYIDEFKRFITDYPYMDFERWLEALDNINAQPMIYVDEAAELIRRLNYTARASQFKVVLIWLPERFKEETANKMLKIIEEPSADTIFVLVSNNPRAILPTITSRCQPLRVRRYSDDDVAATLTADYATDQATALSVARLAEGNMNRALALLDTRNEGSEMLDTFISLMRLAYQRRVPQLRAWSVDVAAWGRERIMAFLEYCARLMRENFMLHIGSSDLAALTVAEQEFCSRFSPFINERNVVELLEQLNRARTDIAGNVNAKIVLFDLAIKVILLLRR